MLIFTRCPHCEYYYELERNLLGESVPCYKCHEEFVVVRAEKAVSAPLRMKSRFLSEQARYRPSSRNENKDPHYSREKPAKASLIVPPPPEESWKPAGAMAEDGEGRFTEFRHNSRALEKFLEREKISGDHSWLLALGAAMTAVMVILFLAGMIYLITRR